MALSFFGDSEKNALSSSFQIIPQKKPVQKTGGQITNL
jgi:hypothetical protein